MNLSKETANNQQSKPKWKLAKLAWLSPLIGIVLIVVSLIVPLPYPFGSDLIVAILVGAPILSIFFTILCFVFQNKYSNTTKHAIGGIGILILVSLFVYTVNRCVKNRLENDPLCGWCRR